MTPTKEELEILLKECDKEKLHLSGHIQPFGALLGVKKEDFTVCYASQNAEAFLHVSPSVLLGKPVHALLPFFHPLLDAFIKNDSKDLFSYKNVNYRNETLDIKLSEANAMVLIECEKPYFHESKNNEALQCGIDLLKPPYHAKELPSFYALLVKGIFDTIKYDRVMLYQFQDDWSGEVVAEMTKEGMGSYMGLRFPASDIPSIARALYLKNPFRHIADTQAINVPILSLDESTPDLTYSDTRSVSPVHIEYMNNMGMKGSFSISIVIFGELWGLVACHNTTPKYLCVELRQMCRTLAHSFAIGISSFQTNEKLQKLDSTERTLNLMMESALRHDDLFDGLEAAQDSLMHLIACDGFSLVIDDHALHFGDVLDEDDLENLDRWFSSGFAQNSFTTDSIIHSPLRSVLKSGNIAGILATKINSSLGKKIRLYWFRNELKQEIAWAGNPDKPVIENAGALKLSPRRSFERWIEVKSGYAKAWSRLDSLSSMKLSKTFYRWL